LLTAVFSIGPVSLNIHSVFRDNPENRKARAGPRI
jgi:hypothetical protein